MSDLLARRGFLRGLAHLPLVGGGVALLGNPTAAAEPVTEALLDRYLAWLAYEHRQAVREHKFRSAFKSALRHPGEEAPHAYATRAAREGPDYMLWFPDAPDVEQAVTAAPTSTRAAVVLAAAGCDWRCERT